MLSIGTDLAAGVDKTKPYLDIQHHREKDDNTKYVIPGTSHYDYPVYWVVPNHRGNSYEAIMGYLIKMLPPVEGKTHTLEFEVVVHDEAVMKEVIDWLMQAYTDKNLVLHIDRRRCLPVMKVKLSADAS